MAASPARVTPAAPPLWPLVAVAVLLTPLALVLLAWFFANSSLGQDLVRAQLAAATPPEAVSLGRVQWGPGLTRLSAIDVRARNWEGREAMAARLVSVELDGAALLTGRVEPRVVEAVDAVVLNVDGSDGIRAGRLGATMTLVPGKAPRFEGVVAEDFAVRLAWARDGSFSLKDAFRFEPPKPKPPTDKPDEPRDPRKAVHIRGIELRRGLVTLDWPTTGLAFEGIDCAGDVTVGGPDGLDIGADLTGGRSAVRWRERGEDREIAYDRIGIEAFRWLGETYSSKAVELSGPDGARVALAGDYGVTRARAAVVRGDVALSPAHSRVLLGPLAPKGAGLAGLDVVLEGGTVRGELGRLEAAVLAAGPSTLHGVSVPVEGTLSSSALTAITGKLTVTKARVSRVDGPEGVTADGVVVGRLVADFSAAVDAKVDDLVVDGFTIPQGRVGRSNASGRVIVGLTGGRLEGRVDTPDGQATARGDISLSFLTQKATIRTALELKALTGALARSVLASLPAGARDGLAEPLSGEAVYVGTVARRKGEDGRRRWTPRFTLESGAIAGGGQRLEYIEASWQPKAAAAEGGDGADGAGAAR